MCLLDWMWLRLTAERRFRKGTTVHLIWSVDCDDKVPHSELVEGEQPLTNDGPAAVRSIQLVRASASVYNIEVHFQHVYQVGAIGLLVHNSCADEVISLARGEAAAGFMTRSGRLITAS